MEEAHRTPWAPFTAEELAFIRVIASGGHLQDVAVELGISRPAAKHRLEKFYARHRIACSHTALVLHAARRGALFGVDVGWYRDVRLTPRGRQILGLLAEDLTLAQIGRRLFLAPDTVKAHAKILFRAIGAKTQAHAVALDLRWRYSQEAGR